MESRRGIGVRTCDDVGNAGEVHRSRFSKRRDVRAAQGDRGGAGIAVVHERPSGVTPAVVQGWVLILDVTETLVPTAQTSKSKKNCGDHA